MTANIYVNSVPGKCIIFENRYNSDEVHPADGLEFFFGRIIGAVHLSSTYQLQNISVMNGYNTRLQCIKRLRKLGIGYPSISVWKYF